MRVIKLGGRAQGDPALATAIIAAWNAAPGALVIVHGGGDEVSALQRTLGGEPQFAGGRRVTTESDLVLVRMVLSGSVNKRLVAQLSHVRAVGVSGEDGGLLQATVVNPTLGRVGAPSHVDVSLLRHLLAGGFLPVVSPVARDAQSPTGAALNVNGDDAAAAIAAAMGADDLLLLADVPGVLDGDDLVRSVDVSGARALVARGVAFGGMAAKIEAACAAVERGVRLVRVGDLRAIADGSRGTHISLAPVLA